MWMAGSPSGALLQLCCRARLSGLQRLFELSDAEVSKLFPYLAHLLEADPEQHVRPRWDLCQSLLGEGIVNMHWLGTIAAVCPLTHLSCVCVYVQANSSLLTSDASSLALIHCDYLIPPLEMYSPGWSS
jgi:hypothetical protein